MSSAAWLGLAGRRHLVVLVVAVLNFGGWLRQRLVGNVLSSMQSWFPSSKMNVFSSLAFQQQSSHWLLLKLPLVLVRIEVCYGS